MQSFTSRREENVFVKFSEHKVTETAEDSPLLSACFPRRKSCDGHVTCSLFDGRFHVKTLRRERESPFVPGGAGTIGPPSRFVTVVLRVTQ